MQAEHEALTRVMSEVDGLTGEVSTRTTHRSFHLIYFGKQQHSEIRVFLLLLCQIQMFALNCTLTYGHMSIYIFGLNMKYENVLWMNGGCETYGQRRGNVRKS